MYNIDKITRFHIELSSRCNASCPACSRNIAGGPVAPGLPFTELTLEDIIYFFPEEMIKRLTGINFCGNLGDPGTAKDLLLILEYFQSKSRKLIQQVRTNGGMKNPDYWFKVGEFFAKQPLNKNSELFNLPGIVFSVDGLEDTNHIYRRGVKWEKLYANMKAYSESGATGVWEWLVFEHNQHQIEEAKKLAKELGLAFIVKNPMGFGEYEGKPRGMPVYDKQGYYEYTIYPVNYKGERDTKEIRGNLVSLTPENLIVPDLSDFSRNLAKSSHINCKSVNEYNEIYISATGHLLPCCFLGGVFGQFTTSYSRYQFNKMIAEFGIDNLNLKKNKLLDILQSSKFSNFFTEGWKQKDVEEGRLLFCVETCGQISAMDNLYINRKNKTIPIIKV